MARSTKATSWRSRRRSANTARPNGADGPLFLAKDTHALSEPAFATALEVLAANGVEVMVDDALGYTPTPALSHAVLTYNRGRTAGLADGIVITPSHNPPADGGFKYNPPNGGPADTGATRWIQDRANEILADALREVRRVPYQQALARRYHPPPRLRLRLRQRSRRRRRHGRHPRRAPESVRRSAGRRGRGLLGAHRRALRPQPHHPERSPPTPPSAS